MRFLCAMIKIGSINQINNYNGVVWMIVYSPGEQLPKGVNHVPLLAPSNELFRKYRDAVHSGRFNKKYFDELYVPQFLKELNENKPALDLLENLKNNSFTKDYYLCCFCEDENLCHRSIIAGILLGRGAKIETKQKYIKYYRMFMELK